MGEEVTKYQSLCQQLMAETEHLKKVGVSQQQTNAEVEKIGTHVFKDAVAYFAKELENSRIRVINQDIPESLLNKVYLQMRIFIKRALESESSQLILEQRQLVLRQKEALKSDKQNYIRLLKHIKIAICKKETNRDTFSGVLDQIQQKIDELCMAKLAQK